MSSTHGLRQISSASYLPLVSSTYATCPGYSSDLETPWAAWQCVRLLDELEILFIELTNGRG